MDTQGQSEGGGATEQRTADEQSMAKSPPDNPTMRRSVAAAAIGNMVEWYDFGVYGFVAVIVGDKFFPSSNDTISLLSAFGAFAISFLMRPFGAFVFGPLGDRIGRKHVLATTILLMSGATFAIGLLPGYAVIGFGAPILLVLCRMVQGFSTGGEYGGAASFVVEYAPTKRRGFFSSWLEFASLTGFALGAIMVTLLEFLLSDSAMSSWGWRLPFLIAAPLGLIGLYLRWRLEDTPSFNALVTAKKVAKTPVREALKHNQGGILRVLAISTMANSGQYMIFTFMKEHLASDSELDIGDGTASLIVLLAIGFMMIVITGIAALSDRVGRKPVMLVSAVGLFTLTYPAFVLISMESWVAVPLGILVLSLLVVMNMGPLPSTLAAFFPTRTRYSGFSIGYNIGVALFGGTTPFIATYLVDVTDNPLAPAFYLMATSAAGIVALALSKESAQVPLQQT